MPRTASRATIYSMCHWETIWKTEDMYATSPEHPCAHVLNRCLPCQVQTVPRQAWKAHLTLPTIRLVRTLQQDFCHLSMALDISDCAVVLVRQMHPWEFLDRACLLRTSSSGTRSGLLPLMMFGNLTALSSLTPYWVKNNTNPQFVPSFLSLHFVLCTLPSNGG